MFDAQGGCTTDCLNRVRQARNTWREVTGVMCDKKVPVKLIKYMELLYNILWHMGLNEGWEPDEWDWYENVGYKALAWETTEDMERSWKRDHESGNSSGKSPTIVDSIAQSFFYGFSTLRSAVLV